MKNLSFFVLLTLLVSCESSFNREEWGHDIFINDLLERQVVSKNRANERLNKLVSNRDPKVREIIDTSFVIIDEMIEYSIELSGGYQEGYNGSQFYLTGHSIDDLVTQMRENPFGFSPQRMNEITKYLNDKGYAPSYSFIMWNPMDDPVYRLHPEHAKDWFELSFDDRSNIHMVLHRFYELKLSILEAERNYLYQLLEEKNRNSR